MSKYFKNFILCGDIDHHCLLCHVSFQTVDDFEKHIRWEKHRKSIKDLSPMKKFKKDSVFKIEDKYYCEHCNRVMSTIAAISKHIMEPTHQENKAKPVTDLKGTVCKRQDGYIYVDKIKVTTKEWNGLIDGKCIFCDTVGDKLVRHISSTDHMIKMIQSEIVTNEKQYYRKIDEGKCYCFICKKTFLTESISDHEAEEPHIFEALIENRDTKADQEKKIEIAIELINSQRDYFDIDVENRLAICKICTANVRINIILMVEHKKLHNITDKAKIEPVSVNDYFDIDLEHRIAKCKICPAYLSMNYELMIEHEKHHNIDKIELVSVKDYFYIDLENRVATCKICTGYVSNYLKFMIEHKKLHNITDKDKIEPVSVNMDEVFESLKAKNTPDGNINTKYWFDHGKRRAELAQFGRENFIKLVFPGGKGYCLLCGIYVSAHKKHFIEHINGQKHMGHLELKELDKSGKPHMKPTYKTKKSKEFFKGVVYARQLKVVWVNKRFLVDPLSFMLVSVIEGNGSMKMKCYACDIIYDHEKDKDHCLTEEHKKAFLNSDVITTIHDEFIREICSNVYHCGLCNLIFPFWETLDKHLNSWKHSSNKNSKDTTYVCEQLYGGLSSPNLNSETVYAHLIRSGVIN